MFPIQIDADLSLRLLEDSDAETLYALVLRNRQHLDAWLRWSGRVQSLDDARAFIKRHSDRAVRGEGFHAGLWYKGQLGGGLVCHSMNRESHHTEIGYWLGADMVGKGLITRACHVVITYLFEQEAMHRIEIQAVTENVKSRAVAERLGFTFEGIKRESEWIDSAYRDHAVYSLLEHEWRA